MCHKQSDSAVGIVRVVLCVAHCHIEIIAQETFVTVNDILLHVGIQQFSYFSLYSQVLYMGS